MMRKIIFIILIIITLLSICLNVYLVLENKRLTEKIEGLIFSWDSPAPLEWVI